MKPIGKSQGKGIFLIDKVSQIKEWNNKYSSSSSSTCSAIPVSTATATPTNTLNSVETITPTTTNNTTIATNNTTIATTNTTTATTNKNKSSNDKKENVLIKEGETEKTDLYIVQEYIQNPLLIGGKKFDIRLYVLIKSFYPLTIYLYRNGFARFAHTYFKNEKNNMNDITMHLTNVSIQKNAKGYDDTVGGKWFIRELFLYMISRYGYNDIIMLIKNIENCIIQSFLSVHKIIINDKHCFELYGFDILI
uniref:Tubulin--tyrosine ligase-like protein 9 n=1 Tax=Piliocolobus tephrosceles TaxID=591936 RepID=A0A8C9G960_9PRIM